MLRLKSMRGFTLVELMITLALLAIVATIAVPNFVQFIRNNQVQAKADEVKSFLQYARGQAVASRKTYQVTVADAEWEAKSAKGVERKLEFNNAQAQARTSINTFTFNPNGSVKEAFSISVCREQDHANGYFIEVQRSGMVKMQMRGVDVPNKCAIEEDVKP